MPEPIAGRGDAGVDCPLAAVPERIAAEYGDAAQTAA
jgi:hypothetical protein